METYQAYLNEYNTIVEAHLELVKKLISNGVLRQIAYEFSSAKEKQPKETFNVFKLASDLYYRENFHSDIIKAFLDPNEKHLEGNRFLFAFIDMLNNSFRKNIRKLNYDAAIVEREPGKIDVLVYSEESKHCIIIENKIHNASDMPRQLPRYYDFMSNQGYEVDAIVYLPLEQTKVPDSYDWSKEDKNNVNSRLCILPAYTQDGTVNLVDSWLTPCSLITNNIDNISILRQYGALVKSLNYNIMDSIVLTKFYESLLENDNLNTAVSISNMISEIPTLMADRLVSRFKATIPQARIWKYKPEYAVVDFLFKGNKYAIDFPIENYGYKIRVFDRDNPSVPVPFSQVESLSGFQEKEDGLYYIGFGIKDEQKVFDWVDSFMKELKELE